MRKKDLYNVAFVWTPHKPTCTVRVPFRNQCSSKINYVVICCSYYYNGVYSWESDLKETVKKVLIKDEAYYCVPTYKLKREYDLSLLKDEYKVIVKREQNKFKKFIKEKEEERLKEVKEAEEDRKIMEELKAEFLKEYEEWKIENAELLNMEECYE